MHLCTARAVPRPCCRISVSLPPPFVASDLGGWFWTEVRVPGVLPSRPRSCSFAHRGRCLSPAFGFLLGPHRSLWPQAQQAVPNARLGTQCARQHLSTCRAQPFPCFLCALWHLLPSVPSTYLAGLVLIFTAPTLNLVPFPAWKTQPFSCASAFESALWVSVRLNLPGWCWAEIRQFALVGSSSSLHSEACNALRAPADQFPEEVAAFAGCDIG